MNRKNPFTILAVLAAGAAVTACDGDHPFERMGETVASVPTSEGAHAAVASLFDAPSTRPGAHAGLRGPLQVHVVEAVDMNSAERAGLRLVEAALASEPETSAPETPYADGAGPGKPDAASSPPDTPPAPKRRTAAQVAQSVRDAPPPSNASSGLAVRLASFHTLQDASRAWQAYRRSHPQALEGLTPRFEVVDLGARGAWVRLGAGPVASHAAAARLCTALGVGSDWCAPSGVDSRVS